MEINIRYCSEECCFTGFKLQFDRHQKQINSFYETSYNRNNVYLAFRCVIGGLSDVYKCKISILPQPWWPTVMQVRYILTISPPFLSKANLRTALQAGQKGKKIKASFSLRNGYFLPSFHFILLWFKSHQTLFIFVSLAHNFNTLLSYSKCLWNCLAMVNVSSTLRDDTLQ